MNKWFHGCFVLLLLFIPGPAQCQITDWFWLSPYPQGNTLCAVTMIDSNTAVAVGGNGTVVNTTTRGAYWRVHNGVAGVTATLRSVAFVDANIGIAVGDGGAVVRTGDGGEHWTDFSSSFRGYTMAVKILHHNFFVAVGDPDFVYVSTDYGVTWTVRSSPSFTHRLKDIALIDDLHWVGIGDYSIFRTTDGGTHWSQTDLPSSDDSVHAVYFVNSSLGFVTAKYNTLMRTTDGGATWNSQYLFVSFLSGIAFQDANHGYICGFVFRGGGYVIGTTDGGLTWNSGFSLGIGLLTDSLMGIVRWRDRYLTVGTSGSIYTFGDGLPNTQLSQGWGYSLNGICFPTRNFGAIAGVTTGGPYPVKEFLTTTNGGLNWGRDAEGEGIMNRIIPLQNGNLLSVGRTEYGGGNGIMTLSTDNGQSWNGAISGNFLNDPFYDVCAVNSVVWAAGTDLLRSTNSGATWATILPGVNVKSVFFVDQNHGWAANDDYILRTSNGGVGWYEYDFPPLAPDEIRHVTSIHFANLTTGICVGNDNYGITWQTTDGGQNWIGVNTTTTALHQVLFTGPTTAFAVGDHGTVLYSTDAGLTWKNQSVPTTENLNGLVMLEYNSGGLNERMRNKEFWEQRRVGKYSNRTLDEILSSNDPTLYIVGDHGLVLAAAVSPQPEKIWVGSTSADWNTDNNWDPVGIPLPGDSVIIPSSGIYQPAINKSQDQIVIASLQIQSGATLTITDSLKRFTVMGDVRIDGTLEMQPPSYTTIVVGGKWQVNISTASGFPKAATADQGFLPSNSTVYLAGEGTFRGNFHNVVLDTASGMTSSGNIKVNNVCQVLNDVTLRTSDTLSLNDNRADAMTGDGIVVAGSIRRAIDSVSTDSYRFESQQTAVTFYGVGSSPQAITMTTCPDSFPPNTGITWQTIPCGYDSDTHTVTIDTVTNFGMYAFGLEGDAVPTISRFYSVSKEGGSNFKAGISLRLDASEILARSRAVAEKNRGRGVMSAPRVPIVFIVKNGWATGTATQEYYGGWNLVSLPLADSNRFDHYFSQVNSAHVFKFSDQSGYVPNDSIYPGTGYWLKLNAAQTVSFTGSLSTRIGLALVGGWNLIGTVGNKNVSIDNLSVQPPSSAIVTSKVFGYNHSYYQATALQPGLGYWLKLSSAGELDINGFGMAPKTDAVDLTASLNRLEIEDASGSSQTLYFGANNTFNASEYELPPLPPDGSFDARFGSGRMVELYPSVVENTQRYPVQLHSAQFPVTVRCVLQDGMHDGSVMLGTDRPGESGVLLHGAGRVEITDPAIEAFSLTIGSGQGQLPKQYALRQNYPNPFNPTTIIGYDLPEDSRVNIRVYDVLGRVAATLVDGKEIRAGSWSVQLHGENLSSGVYFYRIDARALGNPATTFTKVMKLLFMK